MHVPIQIKAIEHCAAFTVFQNGIFDLYIPSFFFKFRRCKLKEFLSRNRRAWLYSNNTPVFYCCGMF